jgi:hypothetical protein
LANRLLHVGKLSSIANMPLLLATIAFAVAIRIFVSIFEDLLVEYL